MTAIKAQTEALSSHLALQREPHKGIESGAQFGKQQLKGPIDRVTHRKALWLMVFMGRWPKLFQQQKYLKGKKSTEGSFDGSHKLETTLGYESKLGHPSRWQ